MRIGLMLRDVSTSLLKRPVTEKYPFERREAPERLRGKLHWDPEHCSGCGLCVKDCPSGAVEMIVIDKEAKRFVLCYLPDRCTFCAQCIHSCRQECLSMASDEWELAALTREPFRIYYGDEANVRHVMENSIQTNS